jgi:hypothetical protein
MLNANALSLQEEQGVISSRLKKKSKYSNGIQWYPMV